MTNLKKYKTDRNKYPYLFEVQEVINDGENEISNFKFNILVQNFISQEYFIKDL